VIVEVCCTLCSRTSLQSRTTECWAGSRWALPCIWCISFLILICVWKWLPVRHKSFVSMTGTRTRDWFDLKIYSHARLLCADNILLLHCVTVGCDDNAGDEVHLSSPPASSRTVKPSIITPQLIRPFPKADACKGKAWSQKIKRTWILTDMPETKLLEETEVMRLQRRAKPTAGKVDSKLATGNFICSCKFNDVWSVRTGAVLEQRRGDMRSSRPSVDRSENKELSLQVTVSVWAVRYCQQITSELYAHDKLHWELTWKYHLNLRESVWLKTYLSIRYSIYQSISLSIYLSISHSVISVCSIFFGITSYLFVTFLILRFFSVSRISLFLIL